MGLFTLASELVDAILSNLDLHLDLIHFACTCKLAASYVIPRQIEYRTIHIDRLMPDLWAHLASRPDLARNIRTVRLTRHGEVFPRSWRNDSSGDSADEQDYFSNMTKALGHMSKLQTFICRHKTGALTDDMYNQPLFSSVVSGKKSLKNLAIYEAFGLPKWPNLLDFWDTNVDLSTVEYLQLEWRKQLPIPLSSLFPNLEKLVSLCISGGTQDPVSFNFRAPCLRTFIMYEILWSDLHDEIGVFLSNHPSIENLFWFPSRFTLPLGSLPNLKHAFTSVEFFGALEQSYQASSGTGLSPFQYEIQSLYVESCNLDFLVSLRCLDRGSLRRIRISQRINSPSELRRFAETFPMIQWLAIYRAQISCMSWEEWLDILPLFSNLEVIRGLWFLADVDNKEDKTLYLAKQVASVCPKLNRIQKLRYPSRQDVIISRSGGEVLVSYDQEPLVSPRRSDFDQVEDLILYQ
ncbi:hypothetical protein BDN72DRAFT_846807 [Pluteus cervinus]|uniref:Uncharacterized protein n=1 Tax=Pluteus cervinus TaxID=181527 RepID=A0ACD3AFB9_9AGAR|nr:hypothetical protein BDN72DRAFT_846807 [Pluteus cervinus]